MAKNTGKGFEKEVRRSLDRARNERENMSVWRVPDTATRMRRCRNCKTFVPFTPGTKSPGDYHATVGGQLVVFEAKSSGMSDRSFLLRNIEDGQLDLLLDIERNGTPVWYLVRKYSGGDELFALTASEMKELKDRITSQPYGKTTRQSATWDELSQYAQPVSRDTKTTWNLRTLLPGI